ncbi:GTPase [Nitrospira sp.]|nr:GTPase [Nitrospira sp.]
MHPTIDATSLIQRVQAGDIQAVSRLMTLLEREDSDGVAVLRRLGPGPERASAIGVTGYPGTGKSTLIDQLIAAYRRLGKKVGVLAIDVSSPLTGGAVLGDRVRMQRHAGDRSVFIRSMGTRGHRGGLAPSTRDAAVVLEAAGYEVILIETVGVGQNEVEIRGMAHAVIAIVAPGLGDDIQAMKAGLLEVADIIVVNKGDYEGADSTLRDLQAWHPHVLRTVAAKGEGVAELIAAIAEHERMQDLGRRCATSCADAYPNGRTSARA